MVRPTLEAPAWILCDLQSSRLQALHLAVHPARNTGQSEALDAENTETAGTSEYKYNLQQKICRSVDTPPTEQVLVFAPQPEGGTSE